MNTTTYDYMPGAMKTLIVRNGNTTVDPVVECNSLQRRIEAWKAFQRDKTREIDVLTARIRELEKQLSSGNGMFGGPTCGDGPAPLYHYTSQPSSVLRDARIVSAVEECTYLAKRNVTLVRQRNDSYAREQSLRERLALAVVHTPEPTPPSPSLRDLRARCNQLYRDWDMFNSRLEMAEKSAAATAPFKGSGLSISRVAALIRIKDKAKELVEVCSTGMGFGGIRYTDEIVWLKDAISAYNKVADAENREHLNRLPPDKGAY